MSQPDLDQSAIDEAVQAAEQDEGEELESEELQSEEAAGAEAVGITSHILQCGDRNYDRSTFWPPTTGTMSTRVAFYDGSGKRLILSNWKALGGANPLRSYIHSWYYDSPEVRRSLVLWKLNDDVWHSWASC
ncbi:MAG: hypothetical protein ACJ76V_13285 [Thermoleophilaceae bacterium]